MLVKDIILNVCSLLEKKDLAAAITSSEVLNEEQSNEVQSFVECLNLVRNEIATELLPNVKIEKATTQNGRVDFSSLSNEVIEILSVKDSLENNVVYDVFNDHITTGESSVIIKYNASPEKITLDSEFSSTIPARVFAYGIIKEYYFIQTLYEDATVWDDRFKTSLQALSRKKSETVIPRRRWL